MKKTLNALYIFLVFIGWLWLSLQFTLMILLPWQPVQDFLQKEISRAAGRPVQAERISARISGFVLRDVKVASSAENAALGDLFQARRVQLRWSPLALLSGKLKIKTVLLDGVELQVKRYADGHFNFDGLFGAGTPAKEEEKEQDASALPLDLSIRNLRLTNSHIVYTDEMLHQTLQAKDLFLSVQRFTFDSSFPVSLNADLVYTPDGQAAQTAQLGFTVWPNLHAGDFAKAELTIKRLVFKRSGGVLVVSGDVKNLQKPSARLHLEGEDLSDEMVRFLFPAMPAWKVQDMDISLTGKADLAQKRAEVAALSFKTGGVTVASSGTVSLPEVELADTQVYLSGEGNWDRRNIQISSFTLVSQDLQARAADQAWQARVPLLSAAVKAGADAEQMTADVGALTLAVSSATVQAPQTAIGPEIYVPDFALNLSGKGNWTQKQAEISSFTASLWSSFVASSGTVNWGDKPAVSGQGEFEFNLRTIGENLALLQPYQLRGNVLGKASGSPAASTAQIDFQAVAGVWPQGGKLSEFDTRIIIKDLKRLNSKLFSGKWNGDVFRGTLTARRRGQDIDTRLNFYAKRLALSPLANAEAAPAQPALQSQPSTAAAEQPVPAGFVPINLKAQIDIDSLDAPYIWGTDIHFKADLQNLSPSLSQAHGQLSLQTGKGEIKDLDHLTQANLLSRVLFSSLSAVSKVINSLNVFAVLNGLGQGVVDVLSEKEEKPADMVVQVIKDENGNDVQIMVPYTEQKVDGRLAFELFTTDMNFENGTAKLNTGSFVSDLMSFNLTGDMNFKDQTLDMKVNAAPGRHYDDGIMPLTLTVGGTMDNPKGSMNMTSSLTSLLTQGVANNFASRTVKKGIGGIFSLFKKDESKKEKKSRRIPSVQEVSIRRAKADQAAAAAAAEQAATPDALTPTEDKATQQAPQSSKEAAPVDALAQETNAPDGQAQEEAADPTSGISAEPKPTQSTQNMGFPSWEAKPTQTTQNMGFPDQPAKPTQTTQNTALPNLLAQPESASESTALPLPPAAPEGFVGGKAFAPAK